MKWLLALIVVISACQANEDTMELKNIKWHGHASFMIKDEKTGNSIYYIDPFEFRPEGKEKADIIFITHAHFDHCSPETVKGLVKNDTTIVLAAGCDLNLTKSQILAEPNREYEVKGFRFRTVPAYNIKEDRLKFHPKENRWVGYIMEVNGMTLYHAGDTDFIPEMKTLGKVNVAMLPTGGTYTMNVDEAIEAANAIKADITVPMHYRRLNPEKYREIEEKFRKGVKGKVVVMEQLS